MPPLATILFRPVLPLWLLILCLLAFALLAWYTYRRCGLGHRRQWLLWGLRMAAMLLLVWLALQPERRSVRREEEKPVLAVAIDVSESMNEKLGANPASRAGRAREFLDADELARLQNDCRLAFFEIGSDCRELKETTSREMVFNAPQSNISAAINQLAQRLGAENLAGILLLSDGLDHAPTALAPQVLAQPLLVPILEDPFEITVTQASDVYIDEVAYPRRAVVEWQANIDVLVRRTGNGDVSVPVHLYRNSERLRSSVISFRGDERFKRFSFTIQPVQTGRFFHYIEIAPPQDDRPQNNMREFMIEVVEPQNRVVYLEGPPRWEFKFLKATLLAEKAFKLEAFVRGADGAFISFGENQAVQTLDLPGFQDQELKDCKVVILGDMPADALPAAARANIRAFVESGGGLLLIGGARAYGANGWRQDPEIQQLLPVKLLGGGEMTERHYPVDFTPVGRTHPALRNLPFYEGIPPILSLWRPVETGEFSSVLVATGDNAPVLAIRRYGRGRVAMVLSDSLWRWQLGDAATSGEKSFYARFITQLVQWLAPSDKTVGAAGMLQILTADTEYELRDRIAVGAIVGAEVAEENSYTCLVTTPAGRQLTFVMHGMDLGSEVGLLEPRPGYGCRFTAEEAGQYKLEVMDAAGQSVAREQILVKRAEREKTGAPLNRNYLADLVRQTGGRIVPWTERASLFDNLEATPRTVEIIREYPVWNRLPWFILLVALFLVEWFLRRKADLV
jgi:hypothetical protein